ncbi:capsular polysaccharide biosynthsis protein [Fictibacillus macauensis ZFHKF-1]|uniref:Capsular polysaccharide biosynthsis protein n=1 Tax=Fictibacillus macauensis ZFHKF-1 TaxID=1196324 RepID=I8ALP0_9BACL|nr:glycosyltransferase [Fictibacillus macauensis]EIT86539.1 capsular polysaccharide biosynthsis protein [Fictibacillus macauensis ZFHKF-1]
MKPQLLFVIDSLEIAGAEKSLVSLLSLLDYTKYDVDLMLFAHGTPLESMVPDSVTILPELPYMTFAKLSLKEAVKQGITQGKLNHLMARLKYSISIRKQAYTSSEQARLFWSSAASSIEENPKMYDVAISYAQGIPTFYVADKVKAKKKLAWVNASYYLKDVDQRFQEPYYETFQNIVCVSDSAQAIFHETFPMFHEKTTVIYDINNPELIQRMSEVGQGYEDHFTGIRLLTIGRLTESKGYDIALDVAKRLKDQGVNFRWYALGKGPLQAELEAKIQAYQLENHFILLGVDVNPYGFIKEADIYVQTSRSEGFGLAIAEARMLNVPVVTTEFDAVFNQMVHEKNGLVVSMHADGVFDGIMRLLDDHLLRQHIIAYLQGEKKGNIEELSKVYQLIK